MNKFVVMACKHVGKTTLVHKLLETRRGRAVGFFTQRIDEPTDAEGLYPIYIRNLDEPLLKDEEHLIGLCGNGKHFTNEDVFNTLGVKMISTDDADELIVMDEIGFLEMNAEVFQNKVTEVLSSPNPVLIMLKERLDVAFLRQLKENPNVEFIHMTAENRDEVFTILKEKLG